MAKKLYVFDLEGTLTNNAHRLYYINGTKPDWEKYSHAFVDDTPNHPVVELANMLSRAGAEIQIWTGRTEEYREVTIDYMKQKKVWLVSDVRYNESRTADAP